jgi:hypothetical protein
MIRRNLVAEKDTRVVKWSLLAAAFALSLGFYAETTLERHAETPAAATQTVEKVVPQTASIAG